MEIKFVERLLADAWYERMSGGRHVREDLPPGSAQWDALTRNLLFTCPCGCGTVHTVRVHLRGEREEGWTWDGNRVKPTLSPSLRILEGEQTEHWRGYLQNGEWKRA